MKHFIRLALIAGYSLVFSQQNISTMDWQGQLSFNYAGSFQNSEDLSFTSLRYIPQVRVNKQLDERQRMGLDMAIDLFIRASEFSLSDKGADFYRLTLRYDTPDNQARIGLQKINFGPARLLRVLQWFDQLDPRDPLSFSPGVWAAMDHHYFENGTNLRLWTMLNTPDRWRDVYRHTDEWPWDAGGRVEFPLPAGSLGFTLHTLDIMNVSGIQEFRAALDFRLDAIVGLWSETLLSHAELSGMQLEKLTSMAGIDYTFNVGNGLYVALESLVSYGGKFSGPFSREMRSTALMANYTLGFEDGLLAYLYAIKKPGTVNQLIPTLGWQHTRGNWLFYFALYDMSTLPAEKPMGLPGGTGVQMNIVMNY